MKTTLLVAVLAISFASCKKDSFTIPAVTPEPTLQARIHPVVNEPHEAVLGEGNAVFSVGERVTLYVPYDVNYDYLNSATLTITDESGNVMASVDMTQSTNLVAGDLNVPMELQGANFVFATIDLGEEYAGKTLSIRSEVAGSRTLSDHAITNAFSVQF